MLALKAITKILQNAGYPATILPDTDTILIDNAIQLTITITGDKALITPAITLANIIHHTDIKPLYRLELPDPEFQEKLLAIIDDIGRLAACRCTSRPISSMIV